MKLYLILFMMIAMSISFGFQTQKPLGMDGKTLYENNCVRCHGKDGTRGEYGAKNLRLSRKNDEYLFKKISNGGWIMPKWKKTLSKEQIISVMNYIKTLRN